MDFFERQDRARRKTKWLVGYFLLAVALTILSVYLVFALIYLKSSPKNYSDQLQGEVIRGKSLWHPQLFLGVSLGTLAVVAIGSLYKVAELARGGGSVATALGGRIVNPHTDDPNEQKLRNVVEEMAIASGVPVPEIYVLDHEKGINAFAAGHSTSDAAVGVTRGAIELLSRDELQGVIAHEFSHILNGDMRLNLRLIGLVHGILCLAIVGRILLHTRSSSRSDKKGGNPLPLIGLALMAIGAIGVFFGRMIKAAISRQREFLADSAAVQFTRNPTGLAGALKKIGGIAYGSRLETPAAEVASHMFFGNGLGEAWFNLLATHPPLHERIRLLDPAFNGKYPQVTPGVPEGTQSTRASARPRVIPPPIPVPPFPMPASNFAASAHNALADMGAPRVEHLQHATDVLQAIPELLTQAAREPFAATAMVYALLLSQDEAARATQIAQFQNTVRGGIVAETLNLLSSVDRLAPETRLPLVELALPTLRQLSRDQFEEFTQNITLLIEADQQTDVFEYALQKMVRRHLEPHFTPRPRRIVQFYSLRGLSDEVSILLSALAHVGHDNARNAAAAFASGLQSLKMPEAGIRFMALEECTLAGIDSALNRLDQAAPDCKRLVLNACAVAVAADGMLNPQEAELLRAIADAMECPIPPLVRTA